jgi:hypothetical protein
VQAKLTALWPGTLSVLLDLSRNEAYRDAASWPGAVSVAAIGILPAAATAAHDASEIGQLSQQLERLKRRCARLHSRVRQRDAICGQTCAERGVQAILPDGRRNLAFDAIRRDLGYDDAWALWSAAVSASLDIAERIRPIDAITIDDLAAKFDALLWLHFHHEMALGIDQIPLRHLRAFGRELQHQSERLHRLPL